jgi:hypothetical protein
MGGGVSSISFVCEIASFIPYLAKFGLHPQRKMKMKIRRIILC